MPERNQRVKVYAYTNAGSDGRISASYTLRSSGASDDAYWAAIAYTSGTEKTVGAQAQGVARVLITFADEVTVSENDVVTLDDGSKVFEAVSVLELYTTFERQVVALEVRDALSRYTLT